MPVTKEQGKRMTITAMLAWVPLIPIFWLVIEPLLVKSVSSAMAEDVYNMVDQQVEPINQAFVALLVRDINKTRREIAALKFRQRQGNGEWTADDAEYLADLEIELEALRDALSALRKTNDTG